MSGVAEKPHLLVVDDDDRLRQLIGRFLSEQGFRVTAVADVAQARHMLGCFAFDLMVLDVMLPGETGVELLQSADAPRLPVLMLSALGESHDRIVGLESGAADYLTKPFEPKELVLRIRSILRRNRPEEKSRQLSFGEFVLELETGQLKRAGEPVYLTGSEALLLKRLAQDAGRPVSREALAQLLPASASERSVDVQITRLRKKIEESEGRPHYLQTQRGAGYVLYASPLP